MRGGRLGQHPVDRLIRELIDTGRLATREDIDRIVERIAEAPFSRGETTVALEHRGIGYQGRSLGQRASSMFYHLVQRVVIEGQWSVGTTADEYLADLRRAVRYPAARLTVYARRGGHIAAILAPTESVVPTHRRGPGSLPHVLVVYSADRGIILSGYQISRREAASIPAEARWLT